MSSDWSSGTPLRPTGKATFDSASSTVPGSVCVPLIENPAVSFKEHGEVDSVCGPDLYREDTAQLKLKPYRHIFLD